MLTCGDLGGQACPLVDEGPCPRGGRIATMPACHPMRMAVRLAKHLAGCERIMGTERIMKDYSMGIPGAWLTWAAEVSDE
jgi:hypothetical protein